jgi:hypothetical protein
MSEEHRTDLESYLRLCEGGCHRLANLLYEYLNGCSPNSLELPLAAIRGVFPVEPTASQARNNLRGVEADSAMLGKKIDYESLGPERRMSVSLSEGYCRMLLCLVSASVRRWGNLDIKIEAEMIASNSLPVSGSLSIRVSLARGGAKSAERGF